MQTHAYNEQRFKKYRVQYVANRNINSAAGSYK